MTETPEEVHGKPIRYDPTFNGPLRRRSCTDVVCLLLFLVFIGCWIGVGLFAFTSGDPDLLLVPRDSNGSRCGIDPHVKDRPFLIFFDLRKCINPNVPFTGCQTTQLCVKSCPKESFYVGQAIESEIRKKIICVDGIKKDELTKAEAQKLSDAGQCALWHLPSENVLKRCLPDPRVLNESLQEINKLPVDPKEISKSMKNIGLLNKMEQVGHDIVDDIVASWKEILFGLVIGIVMCILYIAMLRWIAGVMVWISIFGCLAMISFCVYYTTTKYQYYKENPYEKEKATTVWDKYIMSDTFWLVLLVIVSVVLGILLLILLFLRKRIILAIGVIKEASRAVSSTISALIFPLVPWILQMAVIAYTIGVALYLSTVGKPQYEVRNFVEKDCKCPEGIMNGASCSMNEVLQCTNVFSKCAATCEFIKMSNSKVITFVHVFNVFAFFWGVFFVSAFGQMVLAATFATWYWTFDKSKVPFFTLTGAVGRTLRYHIGTLAFGSLIIAICRMIRVALEYIDHKLKKYDNGLVKALLCCMKCFFWCLEKFLKFINKNAYIMCAVHGKNFCSSAKDAFSLLMRNILRFYALDKVTDFLFFLSKLLVALGSASIVYTFISYVTETKLTYIFVPVVFVAICTYLISNMFFNVCTMAVDTIFLCFLEDNERNDGSRQRPYFMSTNLRKILGKKNKVS